MIKDILLNLHWSVLPIVSMALFMTVFFGALIWVFRRESAAVYGELQSLPLDGYRGGVPNEKGEQS